MTKFYKKTEPHAGSISSGTMFPSAASLKGCIIKFKSQDGYGFVRDDGGKDYYFRIESFQGLAAGAEPAVGRYVTFDVEPSYKRQMGKSPRIVSLQYDAERVNEVATLQKEAASKNSGKVVCPHCGVPMIPRVSMWYGEPQKSFCPFCGKVYKNFLVGDLKDVSISSGFCTTLALILFCIIIFVLALIVFFSL